MEKLALIGTIDGKQFNIPIELFRIQLLPFGYYLVGIF